MAPAPLPPNDPQEWLKTQLATLASVLALAFSSAAAADWSLPAWRHLSSKNGELPAPNGGAQQTACVVFDVDKDGAADIVAAERTQAPAIIWLRHTKTGWDKYVIDDAKQRCEAGGVAHDVDGDGDLDLIIGGDWRSDELWWYENPAPQFEPKTPWKQRIVKKGGGKAHHDQVVADFQGTGKPQLMFWNQGAQKLFMAEIPDNPRAAKSWPLTEILDTSQVKTAIKQEGMAAFDVDGDGKVDLLSGIYWFKHTGGNRFQPIQIADHPGRIAAGHFKPGKVAQIVMSPGDGNGPLLLLECTGNPTDPNSWTRRNLLDREVIAGHTLAVADINADGRLDIFCAEMHTPGNKDKCTAWILFGDGRGDFQVQQLSAGICNHDSRIADVNGDGKLDIVAKPYTWDAPRLDVWLNQGVLKAGDVRDGLVVHLGCGDGRRTAALLAGQRRLVHGFDPDAAEIDKAREGAVGRSGVFFHHLSSTRLPYAENMVNLLVAEDLHGVSLDEVRRVLAPLGAALVKDDGSWKRIVKPWPDELDEWTHWLHGPDGNAVARDRVAGPPRRLQWIAGPLWSRHHNTAPSVAGQVSAHGRLFYIVDEAPPSMDDSAPDQWALVARDAFNGLPLWRKPIAEWGWRAWSANWQCRFTVPTHIPQRLVAASDRVYVTLGFNAPLSELDAATGDVLRTFDGTQFTDEILLLDQQLIVAINEGPQKPSPSDKEQGDPPVKKSIAAIDVASGRMKWRSGRYVGLRSKTASMERITHLSMAAGDNRVFFVDCGEIVALSLSDGAELWRARRPEVPEHAMRYDIRITDMCSLVYSDGRLFFAQLNPDRKIDWREIRGRIHAFDAKTGRELWSRRCASWGWAHPADVFVIEGLVWVSDYEEGNRKDSRVRTSDQLLQQKSWGRDFRSAFYVALDPKTGAVRREVSVFDAFDNGHHHRCYRNKATERFLMTSYRGLEFIPRNGQETSLHHWVRGTCRLGAFPCNGMVYANPHPCQCYIDSKLNGFAALAPASESSGQEVAEPRSGVGTGFESVPDRSGRPSVGSSGGVGRPAPSMRQPAPSMRQPAPSVESIPKPPTDKIVRPTLRFREGRLERGPAYGRCSDPPAAVSSEFSADWPTFRHDPARSGSTAGAVRSDFEKAWEARLDGALSASVVVGETVFVSSPAAHRVYALDVANGKERWHFTAGAQVDTPPTIHRGMVLFGCADGYVYTLRAADGALACRLLAAPEERWITAFGDVESAWPVQGSVLVTDDAVYFAAGRSSLLDGGIFAYKAEAATGKILSEKRLQTPYDMKVSIGHNWDEVTGRLADVLVMHGGGIFMRRSRLFDVEDAREPAPQAPPGPLHSTAGLRDSAWFSRVGWYLGDRPFGEYLVFDAQSVYGVRARPAQSPNGGFFTPGQKGYELFAADFAAQAKKKGAPSSRWSIRVPVRVLSMVLAGDTLLAAGTPDVIDPHDPWAAYEGRRGGVLLALSAADGKIIRQLELDDAPVYDGMAVADRRIFVSTTSGKLMCNK